MSNIVLKGAKFQQKRTAKKFFDDFAAEKGFHPTQNSKKWGMYTFRDFLGREVIYLCKYLCKYFSKYITH